MRRRLLIVAIVGILCGRTLAELKSGSFPPTTAPSGDAVIRARAGASEIVITTTNRLAGAIDSLKWDDAEFIDSHDHGRQMQSADSFDLAKAGEFWSECYNPTEAGSRKDGTGNTSSSKLLKFSASGPELRSTTQMAFWLAPGEKSSGHPALNDKMLSDHIVSKRVHIGYKNLANVIDYTVTFTMPPNERHTLAQFEALTAYMPGEFTHFWKYNPKTDKLETLDDGPGEQEYPVVISTEDAKHAMGVFAPDQMGKPGYGRFRFKEDKVVKWNCVFRLRSPTKVTPGDHRYRVFVAVGMLDKVKQELHALVRDFSGH
ncbi:MAG TPA: hypothetical protein VL282_11480 [Tepidisphaeraceae bacterium]|nr:hypothetical protein [Tepidisphaeraceae bacterium]